MYVCVYIYIYIHIHVHISIHISISLSIYIYIYICIYIYIYMNINICVFPRNSAALRCGRRDIREMLIMQYTILYYTMLYYTILYYTILLRLGKVDKRGDASRETPRSRTDISLAGLSQFTGVGGSGRWGIGKGGWEFSSARLQEFFLEVP